MGAGEKQGLPMHGRDHRKGGSDPIVGGGIEFDTYPQDGGWLYIRVFDGSELSGAPGSGQAFQLIDDSFDGSLWTSKGGILFRSSYQGGAFNSRIDLAHGADLGVYISAGETFGSTGDVSINTPNGKFSVRGTNGVDVQVLAGIGMICDGPINLNPGSAGIGDCVITVGNDCLVSLAAGPGSGTVFRVSTPIVGVGTALFEVRDDGSVHGRASVGAITWDL